MADLHNTFIQQGQEKCLPVVGEVVDFVDVPIDNSTASNGPKVAKKLTKTEHFPATDQPPASGFLPASC